MMAMEILRWGYDAMAEMKTLNGYEVVDAASRQEINKLKFDANQYSLPILALEGNIEAMTKDNAVDMNYTFNDISGTCSVKWQGSSSLAYPKKNYTIKFDNAFEAASGWGEQKKYCAKANYIDATHAKNVVSAKLWGDIVKSRENKPESLGSLPNGGAIDGFPIIITINGEFYGLYTFNIPKDGWMFGMGAGENEGIVCADYHVAATQFKGEANLSDDFELEYVSDKDNADWLLESLNRMINACINSDGTDLDTTVAQYLDLDSVIDYYIFAVLLGGSDISDKNYLLATYDGVKWFFSAYDLDTVYGGSWDGKTFYNEFVFPTITDYKNLHRAMELIYKYKQEQLKSRYYELRESVLSEGNIWVKFANFVNQIPSPVYVEDVKRWGGVPSSSVNSVADIAFWYALRARAIDKEVNALSNDDSSENLYSCGSISDDYVWADSGEPSQLIIDAALKTITTDATTDGDKAFLRTTLFDAEDGNYNLSATFTMESGTPTPRFLLRCFDSNGEIVTDNFNNFSYLSFYNAHFVDSDNTTFDLPDSVSQFQVGFVFKADVNNHLTISNITLTKE